MLNNYIKIAWRNLVRDKGFAAINILGLTVGLMAVTAIGLWIQHEFSYDRLYSQSDRLYQVFTSDEFDGGKHAWGGTAAILGPTLQEQHPEIDAMARTAYIGNSHILRVDDDKFMPHGLAADSAFFSIFGFKAIAGNPTLNSPTDIVLTESLAVQLFGKSDVIGQSIAFDTLTTLVVTAVIEDIPTNSRFSYANYFCSWPFAEQTLKNIYYTSWTSYNHETYVLLKPGVSATAFDKKVETFVADNDPDPSNKAHIFLHPAAKWYLYNKSENGQMVAGRLTTVRLFVAIGVFILLLACINFTNLSTARSEKRAKEVGVRKVVGARKGTLVGQFLTESIFLTTLSGLLSLLLLLPVLPFFNDIVGQDLTLTTIPLPFWLLFVLFILLTGVVAGIYPAFFLSAFKPVKTLKGTFVPLQTILTPRKVLVVLQFTFSIALVCCTLIVRQQIAHVQQRDNGYDKDQLIYTSLRGDAAKNYELIRQELLEKNVASAVTKTLGPITQHSSNAWGYSWPNSQPDDYNTVFEVLSSDADFTNTTGVELAEGRDIDIYRFATDSTAVLLNETAVSRMRLENPIGAEIVRDSGSEYEERWHVVGVVKDFVLQSPFDAIEPLMVFGPSSWFRSVHIRLNANRATADNLETIGHIFDKFNPNYPFEYTFVDDAYARKFAEEQRIAKLTGIFSLLAIFIGCLGLLGLITFAARQKAKEIGIRKVLGASVAGVVVLLSKDFVKLVLIAIAIASPIAWWTMNSWLADFAYRIDIQWWMFAVAGASALVIALLTVSWQAIRAALANPVDSLRDE